MSAGRRLAQAPAWWYGEAPVPRWARLLAPLYGALVALRRAAYRRGWRRVRHPGVPVLVVGNLVAGGSGKTPLVAAIAAHLRDAGWRPGIASRGHGRREPGIARWVTPEADPALVGDEPLLLARRTGMPVRVDRDRAAAAAALAAAGCDIVLCDDGLQHYRLARDLEIEVVDARRRYGNGRLLPAGPLREPLERAADCTLRVVNVGTEPLPAIPAGAGQEWPMELVLGDALPLAGGRALPLAAFAGRRVHAVAGIGDPERFFAALRALGILVVPHAFPDHHAYRREDFAFASALPVLMTEKDAVKCAPLAAADWYAVPVEARLPAGFWAALDAALPARG
ncbi:tetraacyldisaccharide 4'-kinase [Thermomonas flagellata]|uniref:tetraacyldisaccharide 4'-kinase n=1 Tax=Thermomonas flagellata TaxID=2888524 RepID=UPI001F03FACC|nr:tetraacyldisaccharide 4'-kinase [Thermomonas flagellata]